MKRAMRWTQDWLKKVELTCGLPDSWNDNALMIPSWLKGDTFTTDYQQLTETATEDGAEEKMSSRA